MQNKKRILKARDIEKLENTTAVQVFMGATDTVVVNTDSIGNSCGDSCYGCNQESQTCGAADSCGDTCGDHCTAEYTGGMIGICCLSVAAECC